MSGIESDCDAPPGGPPFSGPLRLLLIALSAVGLALVLVGDRSGQPATEPYDLYINLVGADRLLARDDLYDADASRVDAERLTGLDLDGLYTQPTNSFAGPPSTALLHVPFTAVGLARSVALYRGTALVGMVAALAFAACCLPQSRRIDGFLVGSVALSWATATHETLVIGQGHHMVMLPLALAMWASSRDRWAWCGAALAVATLLKLSPFLIVVYLLARGRWSVLRGFVPVTAGLIGIAAAVGRPGDLVVWVRDVLPSLSGGVLRTSNQSIPALLARLGAPAEAVVGDGQIGLVRSIGMPLALLSVALLWRWRRHQTWDPMEIGLIVLIGLAAGPLTWIHYVTWATLPLVLIVDARRWAPMASPVSRVRVGAVALAVVLLAMPIVRPEAADLDAQVLLRVTTSTSLAAVLVLIAVTASGLLVAPRSEEAVTGARPGEMPPAGREGPSLPGRDGVVGRLV